MNAPVLPPGAERLRRLRELIVDVDEAVADLAHSLPQVNDPDLRPRIVAFAEGARATLDAERESPGPDAADRLNELLNGVRELRIPARDADLGGTPTLKALEQATGIVAIRLINALEAAGAMGWKPRTPDLPERMTAIVAREEAGTLIDRIADRLDRVNASLDRLIAASANAPRHQQGLVNFYVGSVRVELNLARMELKVGETRVDFAALWRVVEATADLTADFRATLLAWAARVPETLMRAADVVRQRIGKMVTGIGTTLRFVARGRRRAETGEIVVADPADEPVPEDVEKRARDMILEGRAPPAAWRPSIRRLDFDDTDLVSLDLLSPLSQLQQLHAGNTRVADLLPLAGLDRLQILNLSDTQITDLLSLAGLRGLHTLWFDRTQIADLAPLAGLRRLRSLSLIDTPVTDLSPLAGLSGLQFLSLAGTQVADLSPLAGLSWLQFLYLAGTPAADLSPLAGLRGLQFLYLTGTPAADLMPLAGLSALHEISLGGMPVADLTPLAGLSELRSLYLDGTRVTDLTPLARLPGLRRLYLNKGQKVDLRPLAELKRLQIIRRSGRVPARSARETGGASR